MTPTPPDPLAVAAAIDSIEERVGAELAGHLRGLVAPPRWRDADAEDPPAIGLYLVLCDVYHEVAYWGMSEDYDWSGYDGREVRPNFWMPLPNPPNPTRPAPGAPMLPMPW